MDYIILRDSIRDLGILQSILVRPLDGFQVVAGNHRHEIALDLKLPTVPCIIREMTDHDVLKLQVVENSNRIITQPIEYFRRLQTIIHNHEMTVEELAFSIHRHPDWVRKLLSLNYLSRTAKKFLDNGELSCKIGIELARLPTDEQDELLSLRGDLSPTEYIEMIREAVRAKRLGEQSNRVASKRLHPESFRHFRKVKDEYVNKVEKGLILTRMNATTASEGWDAAFEWILQVDEESLARRAANAEQQQRKEARISELRNLELDWRKHEYRTCDSQQPDQSPCLRDPCESGEVPDGGVAPADSVGDQGEVC